MAASRGYWQEATPRNRNGRLHNYSVDRLHEKWVILNKGFAWRVSEYKVIYRRQQPAILVFGAQ